MFLFEFHILHILFFVLVLLVLLQSCDNLNIHFLLDLLHKVKYKTKNDVNPKMSKELVSCAKMINKFDTKMINYK